MDCEYLGAWIGGVLGLAFFLLVFVYAPMKSNKDECGTVFLCANQTQP